MPGPSPFQSAADAVRGFLSSVSPERVEVKVASLDGMPLLCAVEAVLAEALPRQAAQELVWLSGAPAAGAHVLRLKAFGAGGVVLAEATHEWASGR
jgi:hypothetical protein